MAYCLQLLRFVTRYNGLDLQSSHRGVTLLEPVQSFSRDFKANGETLSLGFVRVHHLQL